MANIGSIFGDAYDKLFGADTSAEDAASEDYINKAIAGYDNIQTPGLSVPDSEMYRNSALPSGNLSYNLDSPMAAALAQQESSAYNDINVDPRLRGTQNASLDALKSISDGGGLTAADMANLNKVQSDVGQADRGRREAIMQGAQARGMSGSGNELLAMLDSGQAATDRANQSGLDVAGLAQQRALDSLMQQGQLAGDMRGQDFSEQAKKAEAEDAIRRFNAANSNTLNLANANNANNFAQARASGNFDASRGNLAANQAVAQSRQSTMDKNTARTNDMNDLRADFGQRNFNNQMSVANGRAGVYGKGSDYYQDQGDRKSKKNAEQMSSLFKVGSAIYGAK